MVEAFEEHFHVPLVHVDARDRFLASLAKGRGNMDWSAMALCAREDAGLPPRK